MCNITIESGHVSTSQEFRPGSTGNRERRQPCRLLRRLALTALVPAVQYLQTEPLPYPWGIRVRGMRCSLNV